MTESQVQVAISELRDVARQNLLLGYEQYLKSNFRPLSGQAAGDYLIVKNKAGHSIAIFQEADDQFRIADRADLLDVGGGSKCDSSGLFRELAKLNSTN